MNPAFEVLFRIVFIGTPAVAGLLLLTALLVKEMRPALGPGIASAACFAVVSLVFFGGDLKSESGWGWTAVGAGILVGFNACAGFVFGIGLHLAALPRYRRLSALPLLMGLLLPVMVPLRSSLAHAKAKQHWAEIQEAQRNNPHALVNDIALPEEEDSGYRITYVDDKGVVRAHNDLITITPYVVLTPGKHRVVLHGNTPKAARLKLEWFLQGSVEVEAGHFYKLQVIDGKITLLEVTRLKETN